MHHVVRSANMKIGPNATSTKTSPSANQTWKSPTTASAEELRKRFNANDWKGMEEILKKNPALLNSAGDDGLTPIQMAIGDGNGEILVEILKRDDLKIGDALLHAVEKGDRMLVEVIVAAMRKRKLPTDVACETSTHFKFYTTPLMLACIKENYDLVGLFIKSGHALTIPHGPACGCANCVSQYKTMGECLEDKMRRIDCYLAASSMAFVLHQTDPFAWAMTFSRYLDDCKGCDPSYGPKYDEMISKLSEATVSLIADCDRQETIETVLRQGAVGEPANACVFGYPRVHEALKSHQKLFLAQPSCHSVMYAAYCGSWRDAFGVCLHRRVIRWALHTVLYPFVSLAFVFSLGKFPGSFKNPASRYLSSFSSYVLFLALIVFYTQWKEDREHLGSPAYLEKRFVLAYLFAYILGMMAVFLTDLKRMGPSRCFDAWWRQYDCVFFLVWAGTFIAYMSAVLSASEHGFDLLHRAHWRPDEPQLLYEIWFTWAAIMSSVRLFYYCQITSSFGVVTISIFRCIPKILHYVVVLFVVLISFAIGLNHMYEHYKYNVVVRGGKDVEQPFQLVSFFTAARYLYWAFYGYLPPEVWTVVVGNVGHDKNFTEKTHDLVSNTGELMSGVYHVVELIILLNLMVSIMTAAAVTIVDNEHNEWKFICTEVWIEWFQDSRTVPPPFNLLQLAMNCVPYLIKKLSRRPGAYSVWDCKYQHPTLDPKQEQKYKDVISSLVSRVRMKLDSGATKKSDDAGGKNWTKAGKGDVDDLVSTLTPSQVASSQVTPSQVAL